MLMDHQLHQQDGEEHKPPGWEELGIKLVTEVGGCMCEILNKVSDVSCLRIEPCE